MPGRAGPLVVALMSVANPMQAFPIMVLTKKCRVGLEWPLVSRLPVATLTMQLLTLGTPCRAVWPDPEVVSDAPQSVDDPVEDLFDRVLRECSTIFRAQTSTLQVFQGIGPE